MTGFEPQASGIGSNQSANWATITANVCIASISTYASLILPVSSFGSHNWLQVRTGGPKPFGFLSVVLT